MKCPKCKADSPPFTTREGVEMNFCRGCKGLWFDKGELAATAEGAYEAKAFEAQVKAGRATLYSCPRCPGAKLVEFSYDASDPLIVDGCATCHGIFLDARELGRVEAIEANKAPLAERLKRANATLAKEGLIPLSVKR